MEGEIDVNQINKQIIKVTAECTKHHGGDKWSDPKEGNWGQRELAMQSGRRRVFQEVGKVEAKTLKLEWFCHISTSSRASSYDKEFAVYPKYNGKTSEGSNPVSHMIP